jgi:UDP-N-acetylmuramoyl-tripeptide--D-alanyl-D-alanine ligase
MQLPSIAFLYELFEKHPSVQTDTRKLQLGDLYFALKGPNFNGNTFAMAALEAGASYAIVDEDIPYSKAIDDRILQVDDVLTTLQALAKHHRQQFTIPFIAITGSNGKTTTKELVSTVLASHYKTYTTKGNLNNHIGVPLTILSVGKDAEMAVIEMGANHQLEIASYCAYTLPTHGMITNCGKAHLEGFGGEAGVRKGKGELFESLRDHQGTAFVMSDYDYLNDMSKGIKEIISYGAHSGDIQANAIDHHGMISLEGTKGFNERIDTQLVGTYNLPNVLAAVTIGLYFKVPMDKIKSAIEHYTPTNSRSQLMNWHNNQLILDAYNANPSSMKLAVENFAKIDSTEKIMCLGGMKELGEESLLEHQALINYIQSFNWEQVVLVGGDFKHCQHKYLYFENALEAKQWLKSQAYQHKHILIKGSRGIQMEQMIAD